MSRPPDRIFAQPRLAAIYDPGDPDRSDLDAYLAMAEAFGTQSVLDVGCGTGVFAIELARRGCDVVGVDPAEASLVVAQGKPGADRVRWIHGAATTLPPLAVDLATMTANVAQVFIDDAAWTANLTGIAAAVRPNGHLVFESRDPDARGWEQWTKELSHTTLSIPDVGAVERWVELTDVSLPLVSFRHTWRFASDGAVLTSDSTLRFRSHAEIESSLVATGWRLDETRDAPDRPGLEMVFVAVRQP